MTRLRNLAATVAALVVTASPVAALAQGQGYYNGHMWGGGGWGMFFGPLMMLFWFALLVGVIVLIVRWVGGSDQIGTKRGKSDSEAMEILRQRFARDEIDKAEFEERRALLDH